LTGCPPGFYLNAQQCRRCPELFYCTGDSLPATPCASGQYARPGAMSKKDCFASVFLVVVVNVPVARPAFSEAEVQLQEPAEERFRDALARAVRLSPDYISLDIIQEGNDPGTTTVTSRVATVDARAAATAYQILDSTRLRTEFAVRGLPAATLISVQVTACVPGYELSPAQTCKLCASNYYCSGGTTARQACAAGSFSPPGANSSTQCIAVVFVVVSATLPIPPSNFTADFQARFRVALAQTAQVSVERVVLMSESRRDAAQRLVVNAQIATDDAAAAETVRGRMDLTSLNANLARQGLPESSSVAATVSDTSGRSSGSSAVSIPAVLGGSIGGIVFLLACSFAGYFVSRTLSKRRAYSAFLSAVKNSKAGDAASEAHFPPDHAARKGRAVLSLRMQYHAVAVLGKGSRGCVVKATKKAVQAQSAPVAIKIIVPKQGKFDEGERRRLQLEARLLILVTSEGCRSAVHAAEAGDVPQRDDACWLIMEALDGETLASELHPCGASTATAVGVGACIQAARDVLAAIGVLHAAGFVHCGVAPGNVIHRAERHRGTYEYALIDFGKARESARSITGDAAGASHAYEAGYAACESDAAAGGEVAYRAPELFSGGGVECEADLWSLGATMFELVSGRVPFVWEGRAAAIEAGVEGRAPDVVGCLAEAQRGAFDRGLGKVIAKALERNPKDRYYSDFIVTDIDPIAPQS
jgi:serine/threonine protein kinase